MPSRDSPHERTRTHVVRSTSQHVLCVVPQISSCLVLRWDGQTREISLSIRMGKGGVPGSKGMEKEDVEDRSEETEKTVK